MTFTSEENPMHHLSLSYKRCQELHLAVHLLFGAEDTILKSTNMIRAIDACSSVTLDMDMLHRDICVGREPWICPCTVMEECNCLFVLPAHLLTGLQW